MAAASAPVTRHQNNKNGTTKPRESSEHRAVDDGRGSSSSLSLLFSCKSDEERAPTIRQVSYNSRRSQETEVRQPAPDDPLLADALSTQEPQDCVVVGGGDHIHKLRKETARFKVWRFLNVNLL